jgi:hypothetical protein
MGVLFTAASLVDPNDATHATRSVRFDLTRNRTATDQKPSRLGCCFEEIKRRSEPPQHRTRTGPTLSNRTLQSGLDRRRLEHG